MSALTILAVIGIPIVGILAWAYEITPGGIVRDSGDAALLHLPRARRAMAPVLVLGVALMAGVTGFAWWRSIADADRASPSAAEPSAQSVAVLPLVDMTSGGGNEYLGDGFAEEISAQLAQIPGLRVAARTSAFEFKGQRLDVRKIGNALGVRNVLEGSVRRDGDKLRVTVQLIDASNGYHVWAGTYDRDWADAIAVQDDISRKITQALRVVLTPESERKLQRAGVVNLAAYDSYLAGVSALRKSSDLSQLNQAADFFGKAMTLDPGFSRAYAGHVRGRCRALLQDPGTGGRCCRGGCVSQGPRTRALARRDGNGAGLAVSCQRPIRAGGVRLYEPDGEATPGRRGIRGPRECPGRPRSP